MAQGRIPELSREALALIALLLGLALLAWLDSAGRMAGMDAGPATDPGTVGFYLVTWLVMMAAMMFPSIAPMVLAHAEAAKGRAARGPGQAGATGAFVAGYLVCWTAFGLAAYALLELGRGLHLGILSWDRGGPYLAGAVILAAAAYQLTAPKAACLNKCSDEPGLDGLRRGADRDREACPLEGGGEQHDRDRAGGARLGGGGNAGAGAGAHFAKLGER